LWTDENNATKHISEKKLVKTEYVVIEIKFPKCLLLVIKTIGKDFR
jgi:hypothetical protein